MCVAAKKRGRKLKPSLLIASTITIPQAADLVPSSAVRSAAVRLAECSAACLAAVSSNSNRPNSLAAAWVTYSAACLAA